MNVDELGQGVYLRFVRIGRNLEDEAGTQCTSTVNSCIRYVGGAKLTSSAVTLSLRQLL